MWCSKIWSLPLEPHLFFFFKLSVLCGDTLQNLQRFLQCINYIILEFAPSIPPLYPCSSNSWNSCNRYHYGVYKHVYTFCTTFTLLSPFLITSPFPLVPTLPSRQGLFHPTFLQFCRREKIKRKTWYFCLFEIKVAIQGVPCDFSMYICVIPPIGLSSLIIHILL
jgi:hypothetical protein